MKILWLASWYPNPDHPYEGDFVQRHAKALAKYIPVTVFFISQAGSQASVARDIVEEHKKDGVTERIVFFRFQKTKIALWDKARYNILYYRVYKNEIREYIKREGMPDLVHIHIPMKAGMLGLWLKRRFGIPYIVSEHSSHYSRKSNDSFFKKSIRFRTTVKRIVTTAAAVTNVSAAVGEVLKKTFNLPEVKTIYNTVDNSLFFYHPPHPVKFRFIHVSVLNDQQKNIMGIIRAVSNLAKQRKDFEFIIVGPISDDLKGIVNQLGVKNVVQFTGEIAYQEVALQMQKASAFVLFSRHENFPCVMVEALSCGLPFITSDVGGIKEAINEKNGILVESENEEELTAAMNRIINEYHTYNRKEIARDAGLQFGYETIGRKFYELYNEVTRKKSK